MASDLEDLLKQMADQSSFVWNDETYDLARARARPATSAPPPPQA